MQGIVRAQRPLRLPVVLSREEVASLLSRLRGPVWLMASLLYGAGLRLIECAELRQRRWSRKTFRPSSRPARNTVRIAVFNLEQNATPARVTLRVAHLRRRYF